MSGSDDSHTGFPGSIEHPTSLGGPTTDSHNEYDEATGQRRYSRVKRVMEAPVADGYSEGQCLITFGRISGGYLVSTDQEWPLALAFAADGVVVAAGDADLACGAEAVEQAAEFAGYSHLGRLPLDQAAGMTFQQNADLRDSTKSRDFVAVTYIVGDVEPDSVVLTGRTPEAGSKIPSDSAIYSFHLSDLRLNYDNTVADAWDELFGFEPVAGMPPIDGRSPGGE